MVEVNMGRLENLGEGPLAGMSKRHDGSGGGVGNSGGGDSGFGSEGDFGCEGEGSGGGDRGIGVIVGSGRRPLEKEKTV